MWGARFRLESKMPAPDERPMPGREVRISTAQPR